MTITTIADILSTQLASGSKPARTIAPRLSQPLQSLPADASSRYTGQMSNRRIRHARGIRSVEETSTRSAAARLTNQPLLTDVLVDESDAWAAGYIVAALCDQDLIDGREKTHTSGLAAKFVDEFSRWVYFTAEGNEHPSFPRDRRNHPELTSKSIETYRKLMLALQAGEIANRALKELELLTSPGIEAESINSSVQRLSHPSWTKDEARKSLWQKHIPICHLAAGVGQAWKLYGVDLTWRATFWLDLFRTNGSWVGIALSIAAERRDALIASGLIRQAEQKLLTIGRAPAAFVQFAPVRRPGGTG